VCVFMCVCVYVCVYVCVCGDGGGRSGLVEGVEANRSLRCVGSAGGRVPAPGASPPSRSPLPAPFLSLRRACPPSLPAGSLQFPMGRPLPELVTCSGAGRSGCLTVASRGLRPVVSMRMAALDACAAFTVRCCRDDFYLPPTARSRTDIDVPHEFLFVRTVSRRPRPPPQRCPRVSGLPPAHTCARPSFFGC
jgi:hypothetical protein